MTTHIKGKGGHSRVAVERSALGAAHVFLRIDSNYGIHVPAAELRDAVVKASALEDKKSEPDETPDVEPFEVGDVVRLDYPGIEGTRGVIVEALAGDTFAVEFHSGHAEVYASGWLQHVPA